MVEYKSLCKQSEFNDLVCEKWVADLTYLAIWKC